MIATQTYVTERSSRPVIKDVEHYAAALATVAAVTLAGLWIAPRWGTGPVDMIYLPAVLAAAVLWGLGPALAAGVAAALAYNFFFTVPVHTLRMDRVTDVVTVIVLLIVALVTSRLAAGMRSHAQLATAHATRNATIAGFARRLLSSSGEDEIARSACIELRRLFNCNVLLVRGLPEPQIIAGDPEGNRLGPSDIGAAALAIESGDPAGRGNSRSAEWVFYPLRSTGAVLAAIGLARDDGMPPVDEHQLLLLSNLFDQTALALERAQLEDAAREFAAVRERDRVRATLLSSIGQDVTPRLTVMGNAVRELRRAGSSDKNLVSAIGSELVKLDRYMSNLLELGPESGEQDIEAGGLRIDLFHRTVSRDGDEVHLSPKEYAVLAELAKHRGRVLSHSYLMRAVWGPAQERQIEYLRVAIRSLRQKLEHDPARPKIILNEPAVGYRLIG